MWLFYLLLIPDYDSAKFFRCRYKIEVFVSLSEFYKPKEIPNKADCCI